MDKSSQFPRGPSVGRALRSALPQEISLGSFLKFEFFSSRLSACCHFRQNQNLRLIKPERENYKMKLKR